MHSHQLTTRRRQLSSRLYGRMLQSVCYRDSSWLISHVMEYLRNTRPTIIRSKQIRAKRRRSHIEINMRIFLWIGFICTFCRKFFFNWTPGDDGPVQPGRSAELSGEKSRERWRWGWRRLDRAVCGLMFLTKRRECGWIHGCGFVFYMIMSCCCIVLLTLTVFIFVQMFSSRFEEKNTPKML